ncbi:MAG: purine-nucleoside phosphorylase [Clostridiales bacterium]|jgi:purine-nucleoside phosphorylase|nr:purine-nucleoside phosphorylase [Clostridiales bacterium]
MATPSSFYHDSAEYLRVRLGGFKPEILLILGSGLGFMAEKLENARYIPYNEIPRFKNSTAPGHKGRLAAGTLAGKRVLAMQGRVHVYEGYTPEEVAFPVRVANLLGADKLLVTCASGGVNTAYSPGDLALLTDIVNLTHTGPLVGFDISDFDVRFFDMSHVFSRRARKVAGEIAREQNIPLREGVYFYMPGPQFETPAEIRAIRALGGDLVGMSTVHECIMAKRCGMEVLGVALVSNMAAGVLDQPLSEGEVLVEAEKAAGRFSELVTAVAEKW